MRQQAAKRAARQQQQQQQQQQHDASLSYEIVTTPERRRRHHQQQASQQEEGGEGEGEEPPTHSPRSGISSLGLASPPNRPAPGAIPWNTGGEPLRQPQQAEEAPTGAGWAAVSQLLRSEGYRTGSGGEEPEEILGALKQVGGVAG